MAPKMDTEENVENIKKSANSRFRKTKKYMSFHNSHANSTGKYQQKNRSYQKTTIN